MKPLHRHSTSISRRRAFSALVALSVEVVLATSSGIAHADDGTFYIDRGGGKRVKVVRVVRTGDPAPGLPDTTFGGFIRPQINNGGQVLLWSGLIGEHGGSSLWVWSPEGMTLLAKVGDPAPEMPDGVVFDKLNMEVISDAAVVLVSARVRGPGIETNVNDEALWVGPPGVLRLILQGGDPAPGTEPGTVIDGVRSITGLINANGEVVTTPRLVNPGLGPLQDKAIYVTDGGPLQLAVRTGDPAPGLGPGVWFDWFDTVQISETDMAVTLRGGVFGPGIDDTNNAGIWGGPPGNVQFYLHEGQPAPGFDPGVTVSIVGGAAASNGMADIGETGWVEGPGINDDNDKVLWTGPRHELILAAREGGTVPGGSPGLEYATFNDVKIDLQREVVFLARFQGPDVNETNRRGIMDGPYEAPELIIRSGDPAPDVGGDAVVLIQQGGSPGDTTLNSKGDLVLSAYLAGSDVTEENDRVIWFFHHARRDWSLLARTGEDWDGGILAPEGIQPVNTFWRSGGSDSLRESFADDGRLAAQLRFKDGSQGIYLMSVRLGGDFDEDGDIDLDDFQVFLTCFDGPDNPPSLKCPRGTDPDFDDDGDVDFDDFAVFQRNFTGTL